METRNVRSTLGRSCGTVAKRLSCSKKRGASAPGRPRLASLFGDVQKVPRDGSRVPCAHEPFIQRKVVQVVTLQAFRICAIGQV